LIEYSGNQFVTNLNACFSILAGAVEKFYGYRFYEFDIHRLFIQLILVFTVDGLGYLKPIHNKQALISYICIEAKHQRALRTLGMKGVSYLFALIDASFLFVHGFKNYFIGFT
jgi:hypothetical protein